MPRKNAARGYGYPSQKKIRKRARKLAGAAVPTKRSIYRDYGRSMDDVAGFTQALVSLLRGTAGDPYAESIDQAGALRDAGMARLQGLGVDPAGAATLGAGTDSTLESLLAAQGAEKKFTARQPGIAASRGALMQSGLVEGRKDALQQRAEAFRSAFQQALPQVQNNAMAVASFNAQEAAQRRSEAFQQQQFEEQKREFAITEKRLRDEMQSRISGPSSPWTPAQVQGFQSDAYDGAQSAAQHGVGPQKFINEALARGIPRQIAVYAAAKAYGSLQAQPPNESAFDDPAAFKQAQITYQNTKRAMDAYRHWMEQIQDMHRRASDKRKVKKGKAPDMSWLLGG